MVLNEIQMEMKVCVSTTIHLENVEKDATWLFQCYFNNQACGVLSAAVGTERPLVFICSNKVAAAVMWIVYWKIYVHQHLLHSVTFLPNFQLDIFFRHLVLLRGLLSMSQNNNVKDLIYTHDIFQDIFNNVWIRAGK